MNVENLSLCFGCHEITLKQQKECKGVVFCDNAFVVHEKLQEVFKVTLFRLLVYLLENLSILISISIFLIQLTSVLL